MADFFKTRRGRARSLQIMDVQFISSVSIITPNPELSRTLYVDALGLPLQAASPGDDYFFSEKVGGCKHFGVWPLSQAAEACFGSPDWPNDQKVPQVSIEFEVANAAAVGEAASELEAKGFNMVHGARTEPWGQTVARLLSAEGAIIGISYAPWMHEA
jgi:catechol 2,3-dioxygenase-like lactoylglutathione lyase family enzyme